MTMPTQITDPGRTELLRALTLRERAVLREACAGKMDKQMAADLGLSEATVRAHMGKVRKKLGADSKLQAVLIAFGVYGTEPNL